MNKIQNFLMIFLVAFLVACESDPSDDLQDALSGNTVDDALAINDESQAVGTAAVFSNYDPGNSIVPSAIDILFSGSEDGTLNIPIIENDPQESVKTALNALDGFSTVTPISTGFTDSLDPATITADAVRMFEVTLTAAGGAVLAINGELEFGVDFLATLSSVDTSNSTLVVVPLKPLQPKTSYYIVITNSLIDMAGNSVGASPTYTLLKDRFATYVDDNGASLLPNVPDESAATLELLRQLVSVSETVADVAFEDLAAINIVMSWSFTTQSIGRTLTTVRSLVGTPATSVSASTVDLDGPGPAVAGKSLLGAANMFEGTISVPYYLTATSASDSLTIQDEKINNSPWQAANAVGGENNLTRLNPLPAATNTALEIPLLITTPVDVVNFPAPWKTVIFQHGITRNRIDMLAVADSLAAAGFATVAIDIPLHGVAPGTPFYQAGKERTFDVDLVTEGGPFAIPGSDGTVDSSGAHWINLANLLMTRDNMRQPVADLFALTAAIPTIDVDGGGADLDGSNIYFVGHSLGAILGTTFLALEPNVKDAVLAFGGASFVKIGDGSAAFGPPIVAGLAAATGGAVDKNAVGAARVAYESFLVVAQTAIDTADPVNHASGAVTGRGMLFFEIVGDGTPGTSDLVVPNTVPDALAAISSPETVPAPLAGTEPLLTLMGLTQVNSTQTGTDLKLSVKFTSGDHSSILDPTANVAVTTELQTEMASFLAQDGNTLPVANASVIQAP